jgi:hypothetical protein
MGSFVVSYLAGFLVSYLLLDLKKKIIIATKFRTTHWEIPTIIDPVALG